MSWSSFAYASVADLVAQRTGLVFPDSRLGGVEGGIRRAMARAGIADPIRYREWLERTPLLLTTLWWN